MVRYLLLATFVLMAGCSPDPTQPTKPLQVSAASLAHPRMRQLLAHPFTRALSGNLGWVEYERAWYAQYPDGAEALLIPVEAEDEIRTLVVLFRENVLRCATVLGFAETAWFADARAETLKAYEGWVFVYDLGQGARRIVSYFEAGQLREHSASMPGEPLAPDALGQERQFSCLALGYTAPPKRILPSIFLYRSEEGMIRQIAEEVETLLGCLVPLR